MALALALAWRGEVVAAERDRGALVVDDADATVGVAVVVGVVKGGRGIERRSRLEGRLDFEMKQCGADVRSRPGQGANPSTGIVV